MITWIQTFFMKHNKWLFSALLIVIIVTFVLTIGNQSFFGGNTGPTQADTREYYGYNLNHPADREQIYLHGELSAMLHPELGIQGAAVQQYALIRVAALGLANELGIAAPASEQVRAYLESLPVFQSEESGTFDRERYAQYRDFIAAQSPDGERTLGRVLREDFRIARVRDSLAGPGYILPSAMEQDFARSETTWEIQLAERSYTDFEPALNLSEEAVKSFYDQDPARFEVPERIRVSAVRFSADRYLGAVPAPTESELQSYFDRQRFRYQAQPTDEEAEAAEVPLEDVRDQVASDFRRDRARQIAQQASDSFLTALYERGIQRNDPAFEQLLQESGGRLESVNPYGRANPPRQNTIPVETFRSMWIYTTGDRYYSDLAPTQDGAGLLVFEEQMPAHIPPFEQIASQVETAWVAETRRERFAEATRQWEAQIREAIAGGTPFAEAVAEAGFRVGTLDSFTGSDIPMELHRLGLTDELGRLGEDQISPVIVSQAGAATIHVVSKSVPTIDPDSDAFAAFLEQELQSRRQNNGWAALSAWTDRTLAVITPEMTPQQQ